MLLLLKRKWQTWLYLYMCLHMYLFLSLPLPLFLSLLGKAAAAFLLSCFFFLSNTAGSGIRAAER